MIMAMALSAYPVKEQIHTVGFQGFISSWVCFVAKSSLLSYFEKDYTSLLENLLSFDLA